jgi:hypothetical protein
MEEVVGSIPTRSTISLSIAFVQPRIWGKTGPSTSLRISADSHPTPRKPRGLGAPTLPLRSFSACPERLRTQRGRSRSARSQRFSSLLPTAPNPELVMALLFPKVGARMSQYPSRIFATVLFAHFSPRPIILPTSSLSPVKQSDGPLSIYVLRLHSLREPCLAEMIGDVRCSAE